MFGSRKKNAAASPAALLDAAQAQSARTFTTLIREEDLYPVYVQPSFARAFGIDPERFQADPESLYNAVCQDDYYAVRQRFREWDRAGSLRFHTYLTPCDGSDGYHVLVNAESVLDGTHILLEIMDVEPEEQRRKQLLEDVARMEKESRSTMSFLNNMSHEIRTPLNGILGMLALARIHADEPALQESDLDNATELSRLLLGLVNDILDMSRIESGKVELESIPVDLHAFGQSLRSMFEEQARTKGVHFSVNLEDVEHRFILGDELRLSQVLVNFISNALKFTEADGSVTVTFKEMYNTSSNAHFMLRVQDTGKGMSPEFVKNIFKPFEQESAGTARKYGGSGLGMSIADNLIKLMGGNIVVDSLLGQGSTFSAYVSLPIADPNEWDLSALQAAAQGDQAAEESSSLAGFRLLLAEDNDLNAEVAMGLLEIEGAEVVRAADGYQVIDAFQESEPSFYDAILMDIQMPNLDGWEATQKIRALERPDAQDIIILALSANAFAEDGRRSLEVGMNGHLSKPIDFEKLGRTLNALVKTKSRER
ncbi:MAG: ATP-binding protein [Coriobacteriia bacterium]|nr:ATP-binding protein [Coriobacteriia bacterium]